MKTSIILMLLGLLAGMGYALWHVWLQLPLPQWARITVVTLLAASLGCLFATLPEIKGLSVDTLSPLYRIGTSALFVFVYLILIYMALDVLRLCHVVPARLLRDSWTGSVAVFVVLAGLLVYGNWHYHHKHVERLTLHTDKPLTRPVRLVLISDLHLGYHIRRGELGRWIDRINAEHPDYVLIAGDVIDRSVRPLNAERMYEEFHRLKAPVYACLGNHEYISGKADALDFFRKAGIRLLRDEAAVLPEGVTLIGRDDHMNLRRAPLVKLMQDADTTLFTLVLDHQPFRLEEAEAAGIDFQFSGHTHYGQVFPFNYATDLIYECAYGSHRRGRTQYYISSGLGIWGGKFRIGTRSEYVVADIIPGR